MTSAQSGLQSLDMMRLRGCHPRWDLVSYPEALARSLVVLDDPSMEPPARWLVLSNVHDAASETWGLRRCVNRGVMQIDVALATEEDMVALLALHELGLRAIDSHSVVERVTASEDVVAVITLSSLQREDNNVVRLVDSTLYDALKMNASDIHLECDAQGLRVLYRLDGVLVLITEVSLPETAEQVISRIKVMAELDIAERRVPQDGRFRVQVNEREVDFRVSVMPSIFGEDAVLRLLDRKALTLEAKSLTLDGLGFDHQTIAAIRRLAQKPHGMLLVTGPTGSGKTTTLYGTITEIHTGRDKIITIEDPVEYRLPGVLQIPVNEKKGLTFARGLRSILRHDPDKIMVGEIRDTDTAQIAVQASLTGHLVFTTVHANNVFDVLGRFLHMGVDGYSFAAALNGIVAQRLLRLNCVHCAVAVEVEDDDLQALGLTRNAVQGWTFKAGPGCGHCRGTGYKGRRAVAELLILNDPLREMIAQRTAISAVKQEAARGGWVSLTEVALLAVKSGQTTLAEVLRVAS
jgi:general secretion pathway protein E